MEEKKQIQNYIFLNQFNLFYFSFSYNLLHWSRKPLLLSKEKQNDTWNFIWFRFHCSNIICHRISIWETNMFAQILTFLNQQTTPQTPNRYYVRTVIFVSWNSKQIFPNGSKICIETEKKVQFYLYKILRMCIYE